jgi:hypothetical protein
MTVFVNLKLDSQLDSGNFTHFLKSLVTPEATENYPQPLDCVCVIAPSDHDVWSKQIANQSAIPTRGLAAALYVPGSKQYFVPTSPRPDLEKNILQAMDNIQAWLAFEINSRTLDFVIVPVGLNGKYAFGGGHGAILDTMSQNKIQQVFDTASRDCDYSVTVSVGSLSNLDACVAECRGWEKSHSGFVRVPRVQGKSYPPAYLRYDSKLSTFPSAAPPSSVSHYGGGAAAAAIPTQPPLPLAPYGSSTVALRPGVSPAAFYSSDWAWLMSLDREGRLAALLNREEVSRRALSGFALLAQRSIGLSRGESSPHFQTFEQQVLAVLAPISEITKIGARAGAGALATITTPGTTITSVLESSLESDIDQITVRRNCF